MIEYLILVLIVEMILYFGLQILGMFLVLFKTEEEQTPKGVLLSSEESERLLKEILSDDDD